MSEEATSSAETTQADVAATQSADLAQPKAFEGTIFDYLPPEMRNDTTLAKTQGRLDVLVNSYLAAQKMIGKDLSNLVEVPRDPNEDGTEEKFRAILGKFGMPETLDDYEIAQAQDTHEALRLDSPVGAQFREVAHKLGILPKQAEALHGWFSNLLNETEKSQAESAASRQSETKAVLQKEWGDAFNERLFAARDAAARLGGDELVQVLEKAGVADSPVVLKAFAEMGGILGAKAVGADGKAPPQAFGSQTPAELREQAQEKLRAAYRLGATDRLGARKLTEEAQRLFAKANGEIA